MFNQYTGAWQNNRRNGEGIFHYATGAVYAGTWVDDQKHGWGLYTGEDGTSISGTFENDRLVDPDDVEDDAAMKSATPPHLSIDVGPYVEECLEMMLPGDQFIDGTSHKISIFLGLSMRPERPPHSFVGLSACAIAEVMLMKEVRTVLHIFLRSSVELKRIYKYYSNFGPSPVQTSDDAFHLSLAQLWRFVKDCDLTSKEYSLAALNEDVLDSWKKSHMPPPLHIKDVDDPHEAGRRVIFREFAEAIVRAACAKYGGIPIEKPLMPDDEENLLVRVCSCQSSMSPQTKFDQSLTAASLIFFGWSRRRTRLTQTQRCGPQEKCQPSWKVKHWTNRSLHCAPLVKW